MSGSSSFSGPPILRLEQMCYLVDAEDRCGELPAQVVQDGTEGE